MIKPSHLNWMHGIGVILSIIAMIVGGYDNPAIGFPAVVAILIALEIPSSPKLPSKEILRIVYGNVKWGGIKRGIFIKELFAIAVIYLAVGSYMFEMKTVGLSNVILGAALVISSIASEIEASNIRKTISGSQ